MMIILSLRFCLRNYIKTGLERAVALAISPLLLLLLLLLLIKTCNLNLLDMIATVPEYPWPAQTAEGAKSRCVSSPL